MSTPKLKFNQTRQYAISFSLGGTGLSTVEYEDFGRCYETPIFNANSITRNLTRSTTTDTFTEWEFARIFMEDSDLNSKIDILISYAYDDYSTSSSTDKENWKKIFFSTIFADLTLNDFTQKSINYDNYDGNVEYDEYNYRFSLDTEDITHHTGGRALATPLNVTHGQTFQVSLSFEQTLDDIADVPPIVSANVQPLNDEAEGLNNEMEML